MTSMSLESVENLIIGAGIAGLGAAHELRSNEKIRVVLESSYSY